MCDDRCTEECCAYCQPEGEESNWCSECGRMKGVGCHCGVPFAERVKSVQINEASLKYGPRRGKRHTKGRPKT